MRAVVGAKGRPVLGAAVLGAARMTGFGPDGALLAGLAAAGALNIHALASLNLDRLLITSQMVGREG